MKKVIQSLFVVLFLILSYDCAGLQRILSAKPSLGRTHFIRGFNHHRSYASPQAVSHDLVHINQQPPIINGSSIHLLDETRPIQAFFSSVHNISSILVHLFNNAQKDIMVAAFSLTNSDIADALIKARQRGIVVSVMMEPTNMKHASKYEKLIKNKIDVYQYDPSKNPHYEPKNKSASIMHHKCCIIDGKILMIGSANLTNAAYNYNIENIGIVRDPVTIQEHQEEFNRLRTYCTQCKE